jgi:hypothetical protein
VIRHVIKISVFQACPIKTGEKTKRITKAFIKMYLIFLSVFWAKSADVLMSLSDGVERD